MANYPSAGRACSVRYVESERTTLDTLNTWAAAGERFDVFACCDATAAHWLCLGGARVLLVGNRATRLTLGLEARETVPLGLMATIGSAVSQEARSAFVIVDYPNELTGDASEHVDPIRSLWRESKAGAIKIEGSAEQLRVLLASPALAAIAIVAQLTDRRTPRQCDIEPSSVERRDVPHFEEFTSDLLSVVDAGAAAILLESLEPELAESVVDRLHQSHRDLPILGCNTGHACPGHVHTLHDVFGLGIDETSSGGLGVELAELVRRYLDAHPKAHS